jgi:hypothetical protein
MIRHIPTPVGAIHLDPGTEQHFGTSEEVFVVAVAANRDDMRVLYDQELIGDLAGFTARHKLLLDPECLGPTQKSEIAELIVTH